MDISPVERHSKLLQFFTPDNEFIPLEVSPNHTVYFDDGMIHAGFGDMLFCISDSIRERAPVAVSITPEIARQFAAALILAANHSENRQQGD
jgi:hypothetical protein